MAKSRKTVIKNLDNVIYIEIAKEGKSVSIVNIFPPNNNAIVPNATEIINANNVYIIIDLPDMRLRLMVSILSIPLYPLMY
jgi:hypothetical protein